MPPLRAGGAYPLRAASRFVASRANLALAVLHPPPRGATVDTRGPCRVRDRPARTTQARGRVGPVHGLKLACLTIRTSPPGGAVLALVANVRGGRHLAFGAP